MRAFLKNNRQAPRKVRLIARAVVGKHVDVALAELSMMPNKAAKTLEKLIASAFANAQQHNTALKQEHVKIENITVDKGITYMRYMPRAFGRATPLRRECSHIAVTLAKKETVPTSTSTKKDTETKKTEKKSTSAKTTADKQKETKAETKKTAPEKKEINTKK